MKITFFIGTLSNGGAERVISILASYLAQMGHKTEILTVTKVPQNYELHEKVKLSTLDAASVLPKGKFRVFVKMLLLLKYVLTHKPDCYISFLPATNHALLFFRKLIHAPIIISERAYPDRYPDGIKEYIYTDACKADCVVFQTHVVKQMYLQHTNLKNYAIVPNPLDDNPAYNDTGKKENKIVAAGRFTLQKNFSILIKAFAKLHCDFADYRLVIYGEGPLRKEYERLISDLGLVDCVDLPGYVVNIQLKIRNANMFVLSSNFEGMPNALMEAMALGLACVSTDCEGGGARELIDDGVNGLLVPTGNVDMLYMAMKRLVENPELAERLGKEARTIRERCSVEKIARQWLDVMGLVGSLERGTQS